MTKDESMEIITFSPQYLELMKALEEARKTLSTDEWQEMSKALLNNAEVFVQQQKATSLMGQRVKHFGLNNGNQTPAAAGVFVVRMTH